MKPPDVNMKQQMDAVNTDNRAGPVLEKLIRTLNNAHTIYYEGKRTHPSRVNRQVDPQRNNTGLVTQQKYQQKYYHKNDGGMARIRVESSATVRGMNITTIFIKNEDGIWEVLTDQACEVSTVFTSDQLQGVYPFSRLFSCLQHPYELHLSEENRSGAECFVIDGKLASAPDAKGPDIAREFTYKIRKGDGLLYSIHEMTAANRSIDIELDKLELNQALNPALFDLPGKPKITVSSLDQYMALRQQEIMKRLNSA
jgi:hypothetical protein